MRIATSQVWTSALNNLMQAEIRQNDAGTVVSTQKNATDLAGYGAGAGVIAAYQSSLAKTNGYIDVSKTVSARLGAQDIALNTTSGAAENAKQTIMDTLANDDSTTLMQGLQSAFSDALNGLNYKYNGTYLFAGGNDDTPPVSAATMSQLAGSSVTVASVFTNGTVKKSSTIDPNTTMQTGMLASDLGTSLMQVFKDIQDYNDDPATGPFTTPLSDAQKQFLTQKAQDFSAAYDAVNNQTAVNGTMQDRVSNTTQSLQNQADSMSGLISDRTDADMSKAITALQQAQIAVQASAQVVSNLNSVSLLNYLK